MFEETFPTEFIGGSKDGATVNAKSVPDFFEIPLSSGITEIYERQNTNLPFIYIQVGYTERETWR